MVVNNRNKSNNSKTVLESMQCVISQSESPLCTAEVLPSASGNARLFSYIFSEDSNLDGPGSSLPAFPYGSNLKMHNIPSISNIIKKVIYDFDWMKANEIRPKLLYIFC